MEWKYFLPFSFLLIRSHNYTTSRTLVSTAQWVLNWAHLPKERCLKRRSHFEDERDEDEHNPDLNTSTISSIFPFRNTESKNFFNAMSVHTYFEISLNKTETKLSVLSEYLFWNLSNSFENRERLRVVTKILPILKEERRVYRSRQVDLATLRQIVSMVFTIFRLNCPFFKSFEFTILIL